MVDASKRVRAKAAMEVMIDRMRDDSLDALIAVGATGHGRLFIDVPHSQGKPVDAMLLVGGVQLAMFETKGLG